MNDSYDVGFEDGLKAGQLEAHKAIAKLGDVEALRAQLQDMAAKYYVERARANDAERERDALRAKLREAVAHHGVQLGKAWARTEELLADLRAVLDRRDLWTPASEVVDEIEVILDREPGREEPICPRCGGDHDWCHAVSDGEFGAEGQR